MKRRRPAALFSALALLFAYGCNDGCSRQGPPPQAERPHIEDPGETSPLPRDGSDGTKARRNAACGVVVLERLEDGLTSRTYTIRDRNGALKMELRPAAVSYVCAGSENDYVPDLEGDTDETPDPPHTSLYPKVEGVEVRWLPAREAWVPGREGVSAVDPMHFIVHPEWADAVLNAKNRIEAAHGAERKARCREAMALERKANAEPARLSLKVYMRTGAWPGSGVTMEELGVFMQTGSWSRHVADFRVVSSYLEAIEAACR